MVVPGTDRTGGVGGRTTCLGGLLFIMLQGLIPASTIRGRTIYYRGYVIQEAGRSIYCSIAGPRPGRRELAISENSQAAMRWIDQRVAVAKAKEPAVEPMDTPSYAPQPPWQFFGEFYAPVFG